MEQGSIGCFIFMKESLEKAIAQFREARTSLEAYRAISSFVQMLLTLPKFIKAIEDEGEKINFEQRKLNADKGHHLSWSELKVHNEWRARKSEALHQLDPYFPFINLYKIHQAVQPEEITSGTSWLFNRFGPDDPLPVSDRKEFQLYLDKLYTKAAPFLPKEKAHPKKKTKTPKKKKAALSPSFDVEKSILLLIGKQVLVSVKSNGKTNGHYVLQHMFTAEEGLNQQYPYAEIAQDAFNSDYEGKTAWRKYYRACEDINERVRKKTGKDDFLIFTTGRTGWVQVNEKYLAKP